MGDCSGEASRARSERKDLRIVRGKRADCDPEIYIKKGCPSVILLTFGHPFSLRAIGFI
ncbi:hypothetical protein BSM4216_2360 [Bacillus smithii]|nr:hypothetical protein BSM4216_2360 [Bacillus smithii]